VIRVLVAEDSATARALLVQILNADPGIRVVGEACDGVEAVEMAQRIRPDLITMDVHMPRLDGLEATREIMATAPTPIVIVTGSTRAREVESSMDTLRFGALDVLVKPPSPGSPGFESAARGLVAMVKSMAQVKVVRQWKPGAPRASSAVAARGLSGESEGRRVVAVASSTGGPGALQVVLSGLPAGFAAPVLVVQHITPGFTAGLAAWLGSVGPLRVKVAEDGEALAAGTVYLAPDGRHLGTSARGTVALSDAPPLGGFRPSGSHLFASAAGAYGRLVTAVILTGMGDDGVAGLRAVRAAGGRVIAQDEATSVVFGMPAAAIAAGLTDDVLPLDAVAARLRELVGTARPGRGEGGDTPCPAS